MTILKQIGESMKGSNHIPYRKNKFILLAVTLLFSISSLADSGSRTDRLGNIDKSFVGIRLDNASCKGGNGYFLPLPGEHANQLSVEFLSNSIDRRFGEACKLKGVLLNGSITTETFPQLQLGLNLLRKRISNQSIGGGNIWLNSRGGLISEAIKIGDVVAENEMSAIVVMNGRCYSACVFIYAAAETRGGMGEVGIHRPFSSEISLESLSYSEYLNKYEALTPLYKAYFSKYGVSPSLVDDMNIVSSDEIRILDGEELKSYGLGFYNIAAKEFDKARTIQVCGKKYYDAHLKYHALIKSCQDQLGIKYVFSEGYNDCVSLALKAYPNYSDQWKTCSAKKSQK